MRGHFSHQILSGIPDCHLTCIDPWGEYPFSHRTPQSQDSNRVATQQRLAEFVEQGRCHIRQAYSMDVVDGYDDESLDFVFIDGDHTFDAVCMDIIKWSRKVRPNGIVACHDYIPMRRGGVMKAVEAYVHCHNIAPWYVIREELATAFWVKP